MAPREVAALYLAFSVSETSNLRVLELFLRWVQSGFSNDLPPKADLIVPFFKTVSYPLGVFGFIFLTYFVIVGASNAVNLTDGLDGLAIMPVVMVGSALGVFAYVTGSVVYSKYLLFPYIPGTGELLVFCAALAGAGLAFLWFNTHPAQVFMGDVGALSLGGALREPGQALAWSLADWQRVIRLARPLRIPGQPQAAQGGQQGHRGAQARQVFRDVARHAAMDFRGAGRIRGAHL